MWKSSNPIDPLAHSLKIVENNSADLTAWSYASSFVAENDVRTLKKIEKECMKLKVVI